MKRCSNPSCRADNPSDAIFCHMCGTKLEASKNKTVLVVIISMLVIALIVGIVYIFNSNSGNNSSTPNTPTTTDNQYETTIRNTIVTLCNAVVTNDYAKIADIYAINVNRYHGSYNVTRNEVVENYKKYDSKFGVYGKQISVRWNTLQIWKNTNGYSVVYVEDYHIDRENKVKFTDFVLEKHIELDDNFQIISEYDVQLSKR